MLVLFLWAGCPVKAGAAVEVSAPSVILMEASTGQVIYENNADEHRSPASVTKIMTLLLTFEALESGKVHLDDDVITSAHAKSMGGSQVYLEEGEIQSLDTMIKCVTVASGNDAAVALAEHIAGSETDFVEMMNKKAAELGMQNTRFEDCCGLTDSDGHFTSARDVAIMSRELITKYPAVYNYSGIWMEDITHVTRQGSSAFTLANTNKLLKQYPYATGLKTGSTSKAKYCLSATAKKDGVELIAVIMGAPDPKSRVSDAKILLNYGFSISHLYVDENKDPLDPVSISGAVKEEAMVEYAGEFRYLDLTGADLTGMEKSFTYKEEHRAPIVKGEIAGEVTYRLGNETVGKVHILYAEDVERAGYGDYLKEIFKAFLL